MVWTWSWLEELHENGFQLLINEQGGGGVLVLKTAWQGNINADTQLAPKRWQWSGPTKRKTTQKLKSVYTAQGNVLNIKDQARKQTL